MFEVSYEYGKREREREREHKPLGEWDGNESSRVCARSRLLLLYEPPPHAGIILEVYDIMTLS